MSLPDVLLWLWLWFIPGGDAPGPYGSSHANFSATELKEPDFAAKSHTSQAGWEPSSSTLGAELGKNMENRFNNV